MKGYERLSAFTTEFPELLILRRFDKLSARILLRLQAELLHLEQELSVIIDQDEKEDGELSTNWSRIREATQNGHLNMHMDKYKEVEKKLKTYHKTVLRVHKVRQLDRPSHRNRSRLWDWICSDEGGSDFLRGIEADPWESQKLSELLTLTEKHDRLDGWLSDVITPLYHNVLGHRRKPNLDHESGFGRLWLYKMSWLRHFGDLLCVLLSSFVPIASIQGLYWIPTTIGRLCMVTGSIIMFSVIVMFVAGCRRSEVFAATSAFAAVLVVFLQGLEGAVNCNSVVNSSSN